MSTTDIDSKVDATIGVPEVTLQVGAKSADYWDDDRQQTIEPTVHTDGTVSFGWMENSGTGDTQRRLFIPVEDIPHLIAFLAVVLVEAKR